MILADNSVRAGALADPETRDEGARGMRRFHELLAAEPRVEATTIQTVGARAGTASRSPWSGLTYSPPRWRGS